MKHLSEIVEAAKARGRKRLAVAYGQDSHTIAAVYDAYNEGLVEPTLFGDREVIEQVCKELNIDCGIFRIVDEKNDAKCVSLAVAAVVAGEADVLMKGLVSTDKYMRGILNKEAGLFPPKGTLSHVSVFEWAGYHKLLLASDIAVIPGSPISSRNRFLSAICARLRICWCEDSENRLRRSVGTRPAECRFLHRGGDTRQDGRPRTVGRCCG